MSNLSIRDKSLPHFLTDPKKSFQFISCSILLGILYYPVFKSLVHDWLHLPDFSHGFFIPIISLYFLWERIDRLNNLPVAPKNSGVVVILLGLIMLLVGNLGAESFTTRLSFLIVLSGIVLFMLSWDHFKTLLFPIAFLLFMIPIPSILLQKITFPMQLFAANVATTSLQQIGIPVLREGNIIHLASTSLEVAEACSGIRSLISLLALGTVFAYFTRKSFWQRLILVLSCFPIAIIVNALRVSATGILADYYGMTVAGGFFHGFSGYLLFLVALALLATLGFFLGKFERKI